MPKKKLKKKRKTRKFLGKIRRKKQRVCFVCFWEIVAEFEILFFQPLITSLFHCVLLASNNSQLCFALMKNNKTNFLYTIFSWQAWNNYVEKNLSVLLGNNLGISHFFIGISAIFFPFHFIWCFSISFFFFTFFFFCYFLFIYSSKHSWRSWHTRQVNNWILISVSFPLS